VKVLLAACYLLILVVFGAFVLLGQPKLSSAVPRRPIQFQSSRAMADLHEIDALTVRSGGRRSGTRGNDLVRNYVARRMGEAGLKVEEQAFGDLLGGKMKNVIGVLPGQRKETILVCAHHDVEGPGPAAIEGSAGLATLLELGRALSAPREEARKAGGSPSRTVLFAAWDGEAFGCAGSTHFVDSLPADARKKLRAVVSLDAVGWKGGAPVLHVLPYVDRFGVESRAPDWLVMGVSNAPLPRGASLPVGDRWLGLVYQVVVRSVDLGYYSDDRPFLAKGVPAVFISNFSLTSSYHGIGTDSDTVDQAGVEQLATVGRSMEAALMDLSTADSLPSGEDDYLVFRPFFRNVFRLTADQMRTLAVLSILPGAVVLIRRRRDGGLTVTRALFFAFGAIFLLATLLVDPMLFPALFVPVLLAGPLLAVLRPGAVWGYLASMIPACLFATLLVPVYLTGSARFVRVDRLELAAVATLILLSLAQIPLHRSRARSAVYGRTRISAGTASLPEPEAFQQRLPRVTPVMEEAKPSCVLTDGRRAG